MRIAGCAILLLSALVAPALATTKGLNQIITPDLEPLGDLSLSYQQQDSAIGNPSELQVEVGLSRFAEVAVFRGFDPGQTMVGLELGAHKGPYLFSGGFANWTFGGGQHVNPQPYVEVGYYGKRHKVIGGGIVAAGQTEAILGYAYQMTPKLQWQVDYQTGSGNSATFGLTYNISQNLSFNPALYFTNDSPHDVLGYGVLSWTIKAF